MYDENDGWNFFSSIHPVLPKVDADLGVGSLEAQNEAMFLKW